MYTPKHCPGFESRKLLKPFVCRCPECGTEKEIFSDEFDKEHVCKNRKKKIDFTKCELDPVGGSPWAGRSGDPGINPGENKGREE